MIRLGFSSYSVAWAVGVPGYEQPENPLDAVGVVRLADDFGLKVVQIADNIALHEYSEAQREEVRDEAAQRGIQLEIGTRGIQTDHLRRYIELARFFASPVLRVVIDTAAHHPPPNEIISLIRAVLPDLESAGVTLAIENHDRFKAQQLAAIITELNTPHVGICLDTVNSFGALEGPEIVLAALGRYVVNLHVKEFVVRRVPHNMGFTVTGAPAGQGMLDIPWLLQTLQERSFNAIIETWLDPEPTMRETIAKEMDWVSQSVAYLRTLIYD